MRQELAEQAAAERTRRPRGRPQLPADRERVHGRDLTYITDKSRGDAAWNGPFTTARPR
ncbi:hypothetical protein [Streptomyces violascens]|uniref:hypothetical protein n=1 Tax=Streptomyces violascens TaxID=67381 RepID=UPI00167192F3|nr:hypothetical protein [Streptomyces violascens]GGU42891.1 hypothetical protein GCM10010289_74570 [Streptomyces violascens]